MDNMGIRLSFFVCLEILSVLVPTLCQTWWWATLKTLCLYSGQTRCCATCFSMRLVAGKISKNIMISKLIFCLSDLWTFHMVYSICFKNNSLYRFCMRSPTIFFTTWSFSVLTALTKWKIAKNDVLTIVFQEWIRLIDFALFTLAFFVFRIIVHVWMFSCVLCMWFHEYGFCLVVELQNMLMSIFPFHNDNSCVQTVCFVFLFVVCSVCHLTVAKQDYHHQLIHGSQTFFYASTSTQFILMHHQWFVSISGVALCIVLLPNQILMS